MTAGQARVLCERASIEITEARTRTQAVLDLHVALTHANLTNVKGSFFDTTALRNALARTAKLQDDLTAVLAAMNDAHTQIRKAIGD